MKPMLFETVESLLAFLDRLPVPAGSAKGADGEPIDGAFIISRSKQLAPKIFRIRDILVKQPGGFGNLKSFRRYNDLVIASGSESALEAMEAALDNLDYEVEELINAGASEELGEMLRDAKTHVARFNMIRSSILNHQGKLMERMKAVSDAFESMVTAVDKAVRIVPDYQMKEELRKTKTKLASDMSELDDLVKALLEYNQLQISLNSMLLTPQKAA